jgi:glycosyltransferase involved in cell wall biosynthesis
MFIVQASNIHTGGGALLLNHLIDGLNQLKIEALIFVDSRFNLVAQSNSLIKFVSVRPTLLSRLAVEWKLKSYSNQNNDFLFFGNLPPLFLRNEKSTLFFQNLIMLKSAQSYHFSFKSKIKQWIEKKWLQFKISNVQTVVVQSELVKKLFQLEFNHAVVVVLPFFNDFEVTKHLDLKIKKEFDFIYVASADPHKNHLNLLKAWLRLKEEGFIFTLLLTLETLPDEEWALLNKINLEFTSIKLIKSSTRAELFELYQKSNALVYPSLIESYGLPLIEADRLKLPIVASDLAYVYEFVQPAVTFDPNDVESIAQSLKQYMNGEKSATVQNRKTPINTAAEFIAKIRSRAI